MTFRKLSRYIDFVKNYEPEFLFSTTTTEVQIDFFDQVVKNGKIWTVSYRNGQEVSKQA